MKLKNFNLNTKFWPPLITLDKFIHNQIFQKMVHKYMAQIKKQKQMWTYCSMNFRILIQMLNSSLLFNKSYPVIYILFFRICQYLCNIIKYRLTEFWLNFGLMSPTEIEIFIFKLDVYNIQRSHIQWYWIGKSNII